jgi:hypothetical protein
MKHTFYAGRTVFELSIRQLSNTQELLQNACVLSRVSDKFVLIFRTSLIYVCFIFWGTTTTTITNKNFIHNKIMRLNWGNADN